MFVVAGCADPRVGDPRYPDLPWRRHGAGSLREEGVPGGTPATTGGTPALPIPWPGVRVNPSESK
jgi:hypothetical protein